MLPNALNAVPPKEVQDVINEYKQHPKDRELVIQDGYFILYKVVITKVEGQADTVSSLEFIRRAYWQDAGNMTLDMVKARLRL